jgi:hypothetical protein
MRTAFETLLWRPLTAILVLLGITGMASLATAADNANPGSAAAPSAMAAAPTLPVPGATTVAGLPPSPSGQLAMPPATVTPALPVLTNPASDPLVSGQKNDKSLNALEDQVASSAKDIVKDFSATKDNMTFDDLNNAKIAIAKIDALIDVEKRLAELEKVRGERVGKASSVAAIPASALTPPPVAVAPPLPIPQSHPFPQDDENLSFMRNSSSGMELKRVTGTAGHTTALLSVNGQDKMVHIGDQLPDGSLVINITPTEVELRRNGTTRQLQMKNVDMVYGRTL